MIAAILLCSTIMGQAPPPVRDRSADLKAYQEARSRAGRDAADQVNLALWCEARSLDAEYLTHLTRAVLIDPNNEAARGLLGQVSYNGKWMRPEDVQAAIKAAPDARTLWREYVHRRAATASTADAQQRLAQWCNQQGLMDQARAHYVNAVRLDPTKEAVWKKLGYKKVDGRWTSPKDAELLRLEADEQTQADKHWKPILEKSREAIFGKDEEKRLRAEDSLSKIADPRAVPMIWSIFVRNDARLQLRAVELLGQIHGESASRALTTLAVYSRHPSARGRAIELLRRRDPRDFMETLLRAIHKPFRYQVYPMAGPGSEGGVFVEGERFDVRRIYTQLPMDLSLVPPRLFAPYMPFLGGGSITASAAGWNGGIGGNISWSTPSNPLALPANLVPNAGSTAAYITWQTAIQRDLEIAAIIARQQDINQMADDQMRRDVAAIERANQEIREVNDRVLPLAKAISGQDFGDDQDAWMKWWTDQRGYVYQSSAPRVKPVLTEFTMVHAAATTMTSCFAAGTLVHTINGSKPIESIEIGDQVLSQNAATGSISYQPVLLTHHNAPTALLKLTIGPETVLATGIHRFWKAGTGWTMARDLKPGDVLRTLGGSLALESVEPAGTAPVFNLDVAENRDFFVGEAGFLVYDFSVVQPVARPFDAPAAATLEVARSR